MRMRVHQPEVGNVWSNVMKPEVCLRRVLRGGEGKRVKRERGMTGNAVTGGGNKYSNGRSRAYKQEKCQTRRLL